MDSDERTHVVHAIEDLTGSKVYVQWNPERVRDSGVGWGSGNDDFWIAYAGEPMEQGTTWTVGHATPDLALTKLLGVVTDNLRRARQAQQ